MSTTTTAPKKAGLTKKVPAELAGTVPNANFAKAQAFCNVDIEMASGTKQVGGVPLHINKEFHAFLIANRDKIGNAKVSLSIHMVDEPETAEEMSFA